MKTMADTDTFIKPTLCLNLTKELDCKNGLCHLPFEDAWCQNGATEATCHGGALSTRLNELYAGGGHK